MVRVKEPTEGERAAQPGNYWFHNYSGRAEFYWDDWDEYRRNASRDDVTYLDDVLKRHFGK